MNKYFDIFEFQQIINIMDEDPYTSLELFEQYLSKYPNDYSAYLLYCSNLVIIGKIDEAEKFYNYFEKKYKSDKSLEGTEKSKKIEDSKVFTKIKLLSYQHKYEELYRFCVENINIVMENKFNDSFFYSKKMTNRLNANKRDENSYLFSQMVKYKESDFLDHIKKHFQSEDETVAKESVTIFKQDFPIEKVIEEIKKYIPSDKKLLLGFYDNVYFFKFDSCGRVGNKIVDYIKVVCFQDTKDFITMCPVEGSKNLPYIDLNYLVNDNEFNKVKRISQIQKFNKRFNKKKKIQLTFLFYKRKYLFY